MYAEESKGERVIKPSRKLTLLIDLDRTLFVAEEDRFPRSRRFSYELEVLLEFGEKRGQQKTSVIACDKNAFKQVKAFQDLGYDVKVITSAQYTFPSINRLFHYFGIYLNPCDFINYYDLPKSAYGVCNKASYIDQHFNDEACFLVDDIAANEPRGNAKFLLANELFPVLVSNKKPGPALKGLYQSSEWAFLLEPPFVANMLASLQVRGQELLQWSYLWKAVAVLKFIPLPTHSWARKIKDNMPMQKALAMAYDYLSSGRFGFFRKHGRSGKKETLVFITNLLEAESPSQAVVDQAVQGWMRKSNVHYSSRTAFVYGSGAAGSLSVTPFRALSKTERKQMKKELLVRLTSSQDESAPQQEGERSSSLECV